MPAEGSHPATQSAKKGSEPKFCYAKLGFDPFLATPVTAPAPSAANPKPSKDLTLTGLYNVPQALREVRRMSAKEKHIHSAGLMGVLKTMHD